MKKKPLTIVTTFGRFDVTKETLKSLEPSAPDLDIIIVDNGSPTEMVDWLLVWSRTNQARVIMNEVNVGCPKALNQALAFRQPGQDVIKLDNDVRMLSAGWVAGVRRLVAYWIGMGRNLAMISAYYEPWQQQRVRGQEEFELQKLYHIQPVVGHSVYHTSNFMDRVGYFDVLRDDHLYGFEDLILSHKASALSYSCVAWKGWKIENIQRKNSLGEERRQEHIDTMRPLYNNRVTAISWGGPTYTDANGIPEERRERP